MAGKFQEFVDKGISGTRGREQRPTFDALWSGEWLLESFNGRIRDECLNAEVFFTLKDVRQ